MPDPVLLASPVKTDTSCRLWSSAAISRRGSRTSPPLLFSALQDVRAPRRAYPVPLRPPRSGWPAAPETRRGNRIRQGCSAVARARERARCTTSWILLMPFRIGSRRRCRSDVESPAQHRPPVTKIPLILCMRLKSFRLFGVWPPCEMTSNLRWAPACTMLEHDGANRTQLLYTRVRHIGIFDLGTTFMASFPSPGPSPFRG